MPFRLLKTLAGTIRDRLVGPGEGDRKGTMIEIQDVRAVVIFADRPRELADWYKRVFALSEFVGTESFIGLATASGLALFVQRTSEGHRPGTGGIRPHFTVCDCEAAFRALSRAALARCCSRSPTRGRARAAIQDPEGNPIGLLAPKARDRRGRLAYNRESPNSAKR